MNPKNSLTTCRPAAADILRQAGSAARTAVWVRRLAGELSGGRARCRRRALPPVLFPRILTSGPAASMAAGYPTITAGFDRSGVPLYTTAHRYLSVRKAQLLTSCVLGCQELCFSVKDPSPTQ